MRRRLAAALLGPWLVVAPWGGQAVTERGAGVVAACAAPAAAPAPLPFAHSDHVTPGWYRKQPENKRDCRGCHVYAKDAGPVDPQAITPDPARQPPRQGCDVCHARQGGSFGMVVKPPAFAQDLGALRAQGSVVFEHGDHLRLACRECHLPDGLVVLDKTTFDPLPIQAGSRACGECHRDGGRRNFEVVSGETLAAVAAAPSLTAKGFAAALDKRLGRPIGAGRFRHQDHLVDPQAAVPLAQLLGGQSTCMPCHPANSDLDNSAFAGQRFVVDRCGTCHIGATGPLQFTPGLDAAAQSASCATFKHGDHVRVAKTPQVCNAKARQSIDDRGCRACHGLARGADGFDAWSLLDIGGAGTPAAAYEGCVVCHDNDAWRTREHGRWQERCQACHSFPSPSMQSTRPMATIRRSSKLRFAIDVQAHRHITGTSRADAAAEACIACHLAPVKQLPSRIAERAFDHASHPTDCSRCHAAVAVAKDAATLGVAPPAGADPAGYRTFDLARCGDCHEGGAVVVTREEFATRSVPRFAHADHVAPAGQPDKVRKNGAPITCATCHQPSDGGRSLSVPDAQSCAECHGHDDKRAPETKGFGPADAGSCGKCHGEGAPAVDARVSVARLTLPMFAGGQVHDPAITAKTDCQECHVSPEPVLRSQDHVFAADGWNKDAEERHRADDALTLLPAAREPSHCEGCHWQETGALKQIHRKALPGAGEIRPPTEDEREGAMGMSLRLFPGPTADPSVPPR